jgi:hypothetical protein
VKRALPWLLAVLLLLAAVGSILWRILTAEHPYQFDRKSVRMEVCNCSGVARAGRAVADELQLRGYDVYNVLGGSEPQRRTTVLDLRDRSGHRAAEVAKSLRVRRHFWRFHYGDWLVPAHEVALDSSRYLEIRLVVGSDYRQFFPTVIPLR